MTESSSNSPLLVADHDLCILREVETLLGCDPQALATAEGELRGTLEQLRQQPGDLELRDRAHQQAWNVLEEWSLLRAGLDGDLPLEQIGRWTISSTEGLWVDCGLVHTGMIREKFEPQQLGVRISSLFRVPPDSSLQLGSLSRWLQQDYRARLGVDDHLEYERLTAATQGLLTEARATVEGIQGQLRQFLSAQEHGETLVSTQVKVEELLPYQARIALLGRTSSQRDHGNRRVHMKVTEVVRRLQQQIADGLGAYNLRKHYQELYSELLARSMELLRAEDQQAEHEARGPMAPDVGSTACRAAMRASLDELRRLLCEVTRTAEFCPPPIILEHLPRLGARQLAEQIDAVLEACPRLRIARQEDWYDLPMLLLLPGSGNAIYDRESDLLLCTPFPTEVRMQAVVSALAQAILAREPDFKAGYGRQCGSEADGAKSTDEAFRRDFQHWVEGDFRQRRNLSRDAHKWFHYNLVVRRHPPR